MTALIWAFIRSVFTVPVAIAHPIEIDTLVVPALKHVFMALGGFWKTACLLALFQI